MERYRHKLQPDSKRGSHEPILLGKDLNIQRLEEIVFPLVASQFMTRKPGEKEAGKRRESIPAPSASTYSSDHSRGTDFIHEVRHSFSASVSRAAGCIHT